MRHAIRFLALALLVAAAATAPAAAQDEKNWSVEVGVDYSTLYMFRGLNLLGEDQEVITPRVAVTVGNWSVWYYGYFGKFDLFDEDGNPAGEGDYNEADFGADYTFAIGDKLSLTVGALTYMYDGETELGLGYLDTYEAYVIAAWDVPLAPTLSFYYDFDQIEGGFLTLDVSHEWALTESLGLVAMGQVGLDFGYNQPGDDEAGIDESAADPNHIMVGADLPLQLTENVSLHALVQHFISLDIADDLGQPDETVVTLGATFSF